MNEVKKISEYSTKELRQICQATAPDPARESKVGLFSRIFSIYTTRLFLYSRITPNQITVLSVIVFFVGVGLFFFNDYYLNIAGSLIIFFSIILDGSDGEVSRFRNSRNYVGGAYTEPVSHDIQYGFATLLLGLALYYNGYCQYYVLLGALAAIVKLEFRFLKERFSALSGKVIKSEEERKHEMEKIKQSYKKKPAFIRFVYWVDKNFYSSTGTFAVLFLFSLMGRVDLALWFFFVGYVLFWLALFLKQILIINKKYNKFNY